MTLKDEWISFIIETDIKEDITKLAKKGFNGKELLELIEKYAIQFAKKLS